MRKEKERTMNSLSKNPVSLTRKLFSLLTFIVMVAAAAPVRAQLTYIYNFTGGTDGGSPNGGLVYNQSDQKLYGTTLNGGIFGDAPGDGTVFSISEGGGFLTVYSFANSSDGLGPVTGVTATTTNGNLIVTAHNGSRYPGNDSGALSLIVQASPPFNTNYWNGGLNYDFTGLADGAHPEGALILADDGNYYGTTADGGAYGMGTIYQINPTNFVPICRT